MGVIIAGLTGGIATGKSTVSAIFKKLGAYIIDADEVAKEVVEKDAPAWEEIRDFFGDEILNPDGSIDRVKLGSIVFGDESKRKKLEGIIHPRVFEEMERLRNEIEKEKKDVVIILDIPLLFESGYQRDVEKVIVVYADEDTQISRLSGKLSREDALKRIKSQMPIEDKKRLADYIIDNTGPIEKTETRCKKVYTELVSASHKRESSR